MLKKLLKKLINYLKVKMLKKYAVIDKNGKVDMYVSLALMKKQKINKAGLRTIIDIHQQRLALFEKMKAEKNEKILRQYVNDLRDIEFALQEAWGFKKDARYHCWWYRAPQCTCPKMDNDDYLGTKYCVFSADCILHGQQESPK